MDYREKRSLKAQTDRRAQWAKQALGLAGNGGSPSIPGTLSLTRSSVLASFSHWLTLGGNKDGADINFTASKALLGEIAQPTRHPLFPSQLETRGESAVFSIMP